MKEFDLKKWNDEVFLAYTRTIEDKVKTTLIEAGVFYDDAEIMEKVKAQVGGNYITRPISGNIEGDAVDLDGNTDIDDGEQPTYSQGIVLFHMGKSFTAKDFTYNLTGKDFLLQVAEQVEHYWQKQRQKKLLAIMKGIFGSALAGSIIARTEVNSTDVNDAVRGVGGDNADIFQVCFMHSAIANKLEKSEKLTYALYNDANGLQRPTNIAYWGGRLVIVNDECPVEDAEDNKKKYTVYFLGTRAFARGDIDELVPNEMVREAKKNGGQTSLVTRRGMFLAPEGLSFKSSALNGTTKVTNTMLATAGNWELVNDGHGHSVPLKNVPFCAIEYTL